MHPTTVARVRQPLDQPARLETVDAVGHRAGRDQGRREEATGREHVRAARAAQRRQHVELPGLEPVRLEGRPTGPVEVLGEARDATEDLERAYVEVRTLAPPRGDEPVDLVLHAREPNDRRSVHGLECVLTSREVGPEGGRMEWDPAQYLKWGGERSRPFFDLLARVGAVEPAFVVDLGCGPGNLTATLATVGRVRP